MGTGKQPETVECSGYVVLEPVWSKWSRDTEDEPVLESIRATRLTKGRPTSARGMVCKVKFRAPGRAFLPLRPVAVIDIPEDLMAMDEVEVDVQDANDDES